jgi:hypothetical protein
MSEATNRRISKEIIEANNTWRKIYRARGKQPGLDMKDHYTDVRLIVDHLIQFSLGLWKDQELDLVTFKLQHQDCPGGGGGGQTKPTP